MDEPKIFNHGTWLTVWRTILPLICRRPLIIPCCCRGLAEIGESPSPPPYYLPDCVFCLSSRISAAPAPPYCLLLAWIYLLSFYPSRNRAVVVLNVSDCTQTPRSHLSLVGLCPASASPAYPTFNSCVVFPSAKKNQLMLKI